MALIDPSKYCVSGVWHSTGPKAEDGHDEKDCPGSSCPVVQLISTNPHLRHLVKEH